MSFLDIYSEHFVSLTVIFVIGIMLGLALITVILYRVFHSGKVKTPWFEIAPDSVRNAESEESGKTRLLLKRQSEYLEHFMGGIQPIFLAVEKEVVTDATSSMTECDENVKAHLLTCLIQTSANELMELLKNYINSLLMINHVGSDRDKLERYAKNHTAPLVGIMRKQLCNTYRNLSDIVCTDTIRYWNSIGISDPDEWMREQLTSLLMDLSELRYSDFNSDRHEERYH